MVRTAPEGSLEAVTLNSEPRVVAYTVSESPSALEKWQNPARSTSLRQNPADSHAAWSVPLIKVSTSSSISDASVGSLRPESLRWGPVPAFLKEKEH